MPNRAERRAQAKAGRRGVPSQYDQTRGRGRSGMIDEYQLQQKSQRLQDGTDGTEWKPSGGTIADTETLLTTNPNYTNPKMFKAPHSLRQWFRVGSWTLIAIAIIAFFVVMWLPSHPMWLPFGAVGAVLQTLGLLLQLVFVNHSRIWIRTARQSDLLPGKSGLKSKTHDGSCAFSCMRCPKVRSA